MQFRLVYQGRLPAAGNNSTRVREKHEIRKVLHKQLARLWQGQPFLKKHLAELCAANFLFVQLGLSVQSPLNHCSRTRRVGR